MNKKYLGVAGIVIFALIISCNTQRQIIKDPIKEKGADFLFQQLKKNEFKFSGLNIKFNAEVSFNKNDNSFSGNLRIRKDSAIWISISPALGIEAFRILITNDSAKLLNRLNTTFFAGDLKYINNFLIRICLNEEWKPTQNRLFSGKSTRLFSRFARIYLRNVESKCWYEILCPFLI